MGETNETPVRILGVDPGLNHTGFGVIDASAKKNTFITAGCIHVPTGELADRLAFIYEHLSRVIEETHPTVAAAEIIFLNRNPKTTLLLGQARGAALACLAQKGLSVCEFSATHIKNSIVGTGRAAKPQVQAMVAHLLKLKEDLQPDAADALACALTYAHSRRMAQIESVNTQVKKPVAAGRLRGSSRSAWEKFVKGRTHS